MFSTPCAASIPGCFRAATSRDRDRTKRGVARPGSKNAILNCLYTCVHSQGAGAKKIEQLVQNGIQIAFLLSQHSHPTSTPPQETRIMKNLCIRFLNDEAGFIVSAELILVSTTTVL